MREDYLRRYFEVATNALVVLASIIILTTLAWEFAPGEPKPRFQTGLQIGEDFSPPAGINFHQTEQTLLLALNSSCGDCAPEVSLLNKLILAQRDKPRTRLIVLSSNSEAAVREYLLRNQLNVEAIPEVNFKAYGLPTTPAAILIDSKGKILDFWVGTLSDASERQILKSIERA